MDIHEILKETVIQNYPGFDVSVIETDFKNIKNLQSLEHTIIHKGKLVFKQVQNVVIVEHEGDNVFNFHHLPIGRIIYVMSDENVKDNSDTIFYKNTVENFITSKTIAIIKISSVVLYDDIEDTDAYRKEIVIYNVKVN